MIRKRIGTRQQAIDYINKVRHVRASGDGIVPATATEPVRTAAEAKEHTHGVLFGVLCDGLVKHIAKNPSEYKDQRNPPQRINRIKGAFGDRQAASIQPYEINEWLDTELAGLAPASKNRYKAMFSAIFTFGVEGKHRLQTNPARSLKQKKVKTALIRFLEPEEEKRLRSVLEKDVDACGPRNQQLRKRMLHRIYELDVAIGTGMRKGEQYSLVWPDVHLEKGELVARDTKNGTDRKVLLIPSVVKALRALKALSLTRKRRSNDLPNPSPADSVFGIGDNKNWFGSALRRAKIKNFRWHDLRHTFCSRLAQRGASLKVIQEAAGHKTIAMSARYAHMDKTSLLKGLALLED
ncbi:tyrosine-type recombinase/integrase [Tunturiibacter gelidoferens]|uniref:Site-specific recombinase XerD n=1 Tax=Tunturiibacter gelidiferens TaxID=3069689 RepID=A0A9X0U749_9BACT|nr:site-specific integrase [Edaphobacter lichenicola]MBB5331780.1 site-specific recombinase XerD [Edaphobacter lichenicola]